MSEPTPPTPPDRQTPPVGTPLPPERQRSAVVALADWIARALVLGPDPSDRNDRSPSVVAWLLPWWVRWLLVIAAAVVGGFWSSAGIGEQLAWGLDYAALIGVSLAASYWRLIFIINLVFAVAWFLPFRSRERYPILWKVLHWVTFLNRQLGHLEALMVWLALSMVVWPRLALQLPFAVAVCLLGPPIINGLGRWGWAGDSDKTRGSLHWRRRPFIYAATFVGLVLLVLRAPHQAAKLLPVVAAIVIGGLAPRLLRSWWRGRKVAHEERTQQRGTLDQRAEFREVQVKWARLDVSLGPILILVLAAVTMGLAWHQRRAYDEVADRQINPASGGDGRACLREMGGPARPEVSLFIVSDTQLHELQGNRFPGQIELADVFVPVAIRPVELDLLSVATWQRFGNVYRQLGAIVPGLKWLHLGDFADLSCEGEMTRATDMLGRFGDGQLAGVAPGNHDRSFTGNFFWSPFWDSACKRRLEKGDSDGMLSAAVGPRLIKDAVMRPVPITGVLSGAVSAKGSALVTVSPLGTIHHRGKPRGVVGVFLDTSDERSFDFGIAGLFGTVSDAQLKTVAVMIGNLRTKPDYQDPVYVLFAHHPFDETTPDTQKRLSAFVRNLDRQTNGVVDEKQAAADDLAALQGLPAPRVLALITAHTHLAQAKYHCMGGRFLREIVVGSTIDPPQEASLVTIGADDHDVASLRLRTLPAVAREGRTCGDEPALPALQCQQVMGTLAEAPECRPLFEADNGPGLPSETRVGPRPDCQVLERNLPLVDRLKATVNYRGPATADEIKKGQVVRAHRLFSCLCRGKRCTPPPEAVRLESDLAYHQFFLQAMQAGDPDPHKRWEPLAGAEDAGKRQDAARAGWEAELACLSWAAAAVQAHKAAGMTMADAIRCGFDDATLPPAKDYVAQLEARSCN